VVLMEFAFDAKTEQLRAALVDFTHTQAYPAEPVFAAVDGALTPGQVADAAWEGIQHDQFLILPHAEVATYYPGATNTDHWPTSMNRLQQRIGAAAVQDRGEDPA
jgi:hypothetical protein